MLINAYCEDKGWLFEDLKGLLASKGAVSTEEPLKDADAYICLRTREAKKSPKPLKTVVQVHDTKRYSLRRYGLVSLVHDIQKHFVEGKTKVCPIGSREILNGFLPTRPTIGFFCREVQGKKRSDLFARAVLRAKKECDFDVLMIGEDLEHIANIGKYERRPATPSDYSRIDALVTTSISQMVPLSAYEALAGGRRVISTPRIWPKGHYWHNVFHGSTESELAQLMACLCRDRHRYEGFAPFTRDGWALEQIKMAKSFING